MLMTVSRDYVQVAGRTGCRLGVLGWAVVEGNVVLTLKNVCTSLGLEVNSSGAPSIQGRSDFCKGFWLAE